LESLAIPVPVLYCCCGEDDSGLQRPHLQYLIMFDVDQLQLLADFDFTITPASTKYGPLPDVDVTFESDMDIDTIRDYIKEVEDGHVMLESLNEAHLYTGDRYYDDC